MNVPEIVCDSCGVKMTLREDLVLRVHGRVGRITCKGCGSKIGLDGRGPVLSVVSGGHATRPVSLTSGQADGAVHLSLFPEEEKAPLSDPLKHTDALKHKRAHLRTAQLDGENEEAEIKNTEAPVPPLRQDADSLTPHLMDDEVPSSKIRLPIDFKSSPMSSNVRDESFRSLFPQANMQVHSLGEESDLARENRKRGPKPPAAGLLRSAETKVDSAPVVLTNKSRNWGPWLLASAATVGLVFNVFSGPTDRGIAGLIYGALGDNQDAARLVSRSAALLDVQEGHALQQTEAEVSAAGLELSAATALIEPTAPGAALPHAQLHTNSSSGKTRESEGLGTQTSTAKVSEKGEGSGLAEQIEEENIPFSPSAANHALRQAEHLAMRCRQAGDPIGEARLSITFAPSGKVTQALVEGAPFAGTATGSCIAGQFRQAEVPAFSGKRVTVNKVVSIR